MAAVSLLKGACTLWEEELLFDFTIEVEDQQFKVHKVIMASVSDYFRAMLTGGMVESQGDNVKLEGLSYLVVSGMIGFIYTGKFGTEASLEDLLACAVYLQIPAAVDKCTELLYAKLDEDNCFEILVLFKSLAVEDGIEKTKNYIKVNMQDMKVCVPCISYDGILNVIDLWQGSEYDLFKTLKQWVRFDRKKRKHYREDLMSRVRFALMTPEELTVINENSKPKHGWCKLVRKALRYHNLPTHLSVLKQSDQNKIRQEPLLLCHLKRRGDEASQLYLLHYDEKSWMQTEILDSPDLNSPGLYPLVVNNYLIVSDYTEQDSTGYKWYIFDPRTMTWSDMPSMTVLRHNFALVYHRKHLYALGGWQYTDETDEVELVTDIEKYSFKTNTWTIIDTKLPVPKQRIHAAAIDSSIYVTGGYRDSKSWSEYSPRMDCYDTTMDCYDTTTQNWETKSPQIPGDQWAVLNVMQMGQEKVLFFMDRDNDHFMMRYYRPSEDQWSRLNCSVFVNTELLCHPHSNIVTNGNSLYLLRFPNKAEEDGEEDDELQVSCAKWTFDGKKITEVRLDDFPECAEVMGTGTFFIGLTQCHQP